MTPDVKILKPINKTGVNILAIIKMLHEGHKNKEVVMRRTSLKKQRSDDSISLNKAQVQRRESITDKGDSLTQENVQMAYRYKDMSVYKTGVVNEPNFEVRDDIQLAKGVYFTKTMFKSPNDSFVNSQILSEGNLNAASPDHQHSLNESEISMQNMLVNLENQLGVNQTAEVLLSKGQPYESPSKNKMSFKEYKEKNDKGLVNSLMERSNKPSI